MEFDFDYWVKLAQQDTDAFDSMRKKAIKQEIDSGSIENRRKLEGLQFLIDMERRRSRNSMDACIRISRKLMDYFHEQLQPALVEMGHPKEAGVTPEDENRGQVLLFTTEPPNQRN